MEYPLNNKTKITDFKTYHNEYYKTYYPLKKAEILEKAGRKENCEFCNRLVSHQNLTKHFKSSYCVVRRNIKNNIK